MEKIRIESHTFTGGMWLAAWLFTVGFLKLGALQGLFALLIWPYYLGQAFSVLPH